jgi:hypothetical protein
MVYKGRTFGICYESLDGAVEGAMDLQVRLIAVGDTTEVEIARSAAAVRAELDRVPGVDEVRDITSPAPKGTMAVGLVEIGAFLVALKPTIELLTAIINLANTILKQAGTPPMKLKVSHGAVEVEFDPAKVSPAEVMAQARRLLPPPA